MIAECTISNVSPGMMYAHCAKGAGVELIDVSTPAEFRASHAGDARNLPIDSPELEQFMASRTGGAGDPVYVMCRGGVRSVKVCRRFPDRKLVNVEGGVKAWQQSGLLLHQQLIWAKARGVFGRSHYSWAHEPCCYGWPEGKMPGKGRRPAASSTQSGRSIRRASRARTTQPRNR